MKKRINYFLVLTILLSSCSTDLDVIGKYKETMVVYGLLDQSQDKQYIKINKAFLGAGNSIAYAKLKDSTQFVNSLSVVIKRVKNGVVLSSYNLNPDNSITKEPGAFYAPDQTNAIYSFNTPPGTLNVDSQYQLMIKNSETGMVVGGQTTLVYGSNFTSPGPNTQNIEIINNIWDARYTVKWTTAENAKVYQLVIRFHFMEYTSATDSTAKFVDWIFPRMIANNTDGSGIMSTDFRRQDFLKNIGLQLKNNEAGAQDLIYKRTAKNIDFIMVAGADDFNTFMEVNAPSTGIIQEKPNYTNIMNGLGIFSSRYNNAPVSKPIGPSNGSGSNTLDSLSGGFYTCKLKFRDNINGAGNWLQCH